MNGPAPTTFERYLAVDLHRHYLVIGGVNGQQVQVLAPRRLERHALAAPRPSACAAGRLQTGIARQALSRPLALLNLGLV